MSTTPDATTTGNPISPKVIAAVVTSIVAVLAAYFVDNSLIGDDTAVEGFQAAVRDLIAAAAGAFGGGFAVADPRRAVSRG